MILVWFCIAWLVGIVLGDWLDLPLVPTAGLTGVLVALGVLWWPRRDVRMPLLLAAVFLLGGVRIVMAQPQATDRSVWLYAGNEVVLEGYIAQQPDRREDKQRVVFQAERMLIDGQQREVDGLVLLRLPPVPELRYGQRLQLEGSLELPKSSGNFNYRAYLARQGIYVLISNPSLQEISGDGGRWWQRAALGLNDAARRSTLHLISEPHASLLTGILLGIQSTLPEDVQQDFKAVGVTHILVISGWNITIIIVGVAALLGQVGVGQKKAAALTLPLIALYVLFVGISPSVLRAAIMGSLVVVARLVDRESEAWTSLLVACVCMTLLDPNVLWDIGFQLSALATAGLFALARPIEGWLAARPPFRWPGFGWTVEPLTATLAASLLALPIILYHFGTLSLIAPIANIFILPVVPLAMLFGALATVCGMVWQPLGQLLALFAWPFLEWMLMVAHWLARVPGAFTNVGTFHVAWVWAYYAVCLALRCWAAYRSQSNDGNARIAEVAPSASQLHQQRSS